MSDAVLHEELQLVVFTLATEEYALPITKVQEINRIVAITKLPQTPDFMEGIINLRGRIIPVIDLRKRFALAMADYTDDSRIIVVEIGGRTVGVIVDAVTEVVTLQSDRIEPPPTAFAIESQYIQGVGKLDNRLLILLDLDRTLSTNEENVLKEMNA
jgi:purine-binding chemotaxis protein CheW